MEILYILLSIIATYTVLKIRGSSRRFRLVEIIYTYDQSSYVPQIRLKGVWFNVIRGETKPILSLYEFDSFLEQGDAVKQIYEFESEGNFEIPSNRKLNNDEKQIIIE